ncbi:hypothetical protein GCM10012285_24390 [Streptomyces kronopolitis]|uniref:Transposase n=1 Tax=Streptomyces kronopolitis TaxID=1612435 RepID=A0ABQ2JCH4_9ACTN|nr:hypothetical protein GCM10012285_24390 [Streptomyces kronopolitis]
MIEQLWFWLKARRQRWTDRTLTRNSFAMSALPRPSANIATASIRTCSRNACLSAVRPHPADNSYTRHTATITDRQPLRHPAFTVSRGALAESRGVRLLHRDSCDACDAQSSQREASPAT